MNKYEHNKFDESSNIIDSEHSFSFSLFFDRVHSIHSLYLIAGILQIALGLSVITVSMLGFIEKIWLSNILSILASISTMIGLYLVYITVSKWRDSQALIRGAMKRVMESKN